MEISPRLRELQLKAAAYGKKAGCPYDQVDNLVNVGYLPYPWQWQFHAAAREADQEGGPVDIGAGGARGPGKSHVILCQASMDDCKRVDGLKCLYLRQTGAAAQESFDDLILKTIGGRIEYYKTKDILKFPNGSTIRLGGFHDEKDIDKYVGIEYDLIIIEELTQLTKEKYDKLRGSLRTSKPNWRPRMYTSFNPGGIGHGWVKDRYVIPYRTNNQTDTRFVPSTYKENALLNPEYHAYLEGLQGDLGKAWREGEWDLFAGQYFAEWRYDKHVCDPFLIPWSWKRFRAIDPGGRHGITSCHWYALDSSGVVWIYREYWGTDKDYDQHADEIKKLSEDKDGAGEEYAYTIIDTAAFAKAGYSETCAEIFERHGVTGLIPAAKERVVGWNDVHSYLRWTLSTPPKLKVFKTCVNMIRTIPLLQHDPHHPEDVDTKGEDHAADELRYLLRTLREQKSPKSLSPVEKRLMQIRESKETDFDYSYSRKPQ